MSDIDKIYAPNIYLFAYQPCKVFGDQDKINSKLLWEKLDLILSKFIPENAPFVPAETNDQQYLGKTDKVIVNPGKLSNGLKVKTQYEPWRISDDTFALLLNVHRPEKEDNQPTELVDIKDLSLFNIDQCFFVNSDLKQSIIITTFVPENYDLKGENFLDKLQDIANQCVNAFCGENIPKPPFLRRGKFWDSYLFEYGIGKFKDSYQHIIILFYVKNSVQDTSENFIKKGFYNKTLGDLFLYRNKTIKAYHDSRHYYENTYKKYEKINEIVKQQIPEKESLNDKDLTNLKDQLKNFLKIGQEYSILLRNLDYCLNSIKIHQGNYQEVLQNFQSKYDVDVSFWENFNKNECEVFKRQIEADLSYLKSGIDLLDRSVSTIRGIVEIEQLKVDKQFAQYEKDSDTKLQNTIQSLSIGIGVGVGTAGVIASSYPLVLSKDYEWKYPTLNLPFLPPHPFFSALFWSVAVGGGIGCLLLFGIKCHLDNKLQKEKQSNSSQSNQNPSNTLPSGSQQEVNIPVNIPGNNLSEREEQERSN